MTNFTTNDLLDAIREAKVVPPDYIYPYAFGMVSAFVPQDQLERMITHLRKQADRSDV